MKHVLAVLLGLALLSLLSTAYAQDAVKDAAYAFDLEDEALLNTAAGAALRACHNAALVLLAGEAEDHALALEYALFEGGRWPVALTGQTFHLF